jgi:4-amino-4-deoxy-L-arabinose transferase-like glycosyltransferase
MSVRRHWSVAVFAAASFLAALGVRHWIVPFGTGDADEGAYAHLAALLRHRQVTMSSATHVPFFRPWLTGEHAGHLFFQYEPGWPAVLAVSQSVLGSKLFAPALCAAGLVCATYALTWQVFGSRRSAIIAAALVTLSPLFLLHSALYLSYLFTTLLATVALMCAFVAVRRASTGWAAATGAALGAMVLSRPLDGALTGLTVALLAGLATRQNLGRLGRFVVAMAAGAVPFLIVAAIFNFRTTGSMASFPLTASDPRDTFGFGDRGLQVGTASLHYDVRTAVDALRLNARGAVGWIFGGLVTVVVAVWAATLRERRRERLVLAFNVVLFPMAYFFWWATALSAQGATNGLGPHYYVPSFVPLAVLAADGFARVSRRHLAAGVAIAVVALVITFFNVRDKVDGQRYATDTFVELNDAIPTNLDHALVFVESDLVQNFTSVQYPFLISDPDIADPILFPSDRHGEDGWLMQAFPERRAYLLHRELRRGDDLLHPRLVLSEIHADSGSDVLLRAHVTPSVPDHLQTFVESDGIRVPLGSSSSSDGPTEVDVRLVSSGNIASEPGLVRLSPGLHDVKVGVERANGEQWARVYRAVVSDDGTVTVVRPGTGEHRVDFGNGPVMLREDVSSVIDDASP